jgi:hypothetical protein
MKTPDDDFLTADVPEPDAESTAAERAHAKAFAELVDKTISSGRLPPAMSADDRALLEVATVIRAASGGMPLAQSKQRSLVEDALRQAVGGHAATSLSTTPVIEMRRRRWVPWSIAGAATLVAAAAIVLLVIRKPTVVTVPTAAAVPAHWKSRPADPLIGKISNDCGTQNANEIARASAAMTCAKEATVKTSARIDHIFADRLEGYRDRRFARRGGKR